jgi:tRNA(adenine34) deaminase
MLGVERAIALARQASENHEFPVGAVVVLNGRIIGEGMNQKETLNDPSAHAELLAIRDAARFLNNWRLVGAVLVTTLEPCPMCLGAILQARIAHVVFLAKDIRWGACGSVMDFSCHEALNHRCRLDYFQNSDVV